MRFIEKLDTFINVWVFLYLFYLIYNLLAINITPPTHMIVIGFLYMAYMIGNHIYNDIKKDNG